MKRTKDRAAPHTMGTRPTPSSPIPQQRAFFDTYPEYAATAILDHLRATEYRYLDAKNHLYLDYAGGGLPTETQSKTHAARGRTDSHDAHHATTPSSVTLPELVEQARATVLRFFNASAAEYTAIFTPSAIEACRLVGETYPFQPGTQFVQLADDHNSVHKIREYARRRGAQIATIDVVPPELRADETEIHTALDRPPPPSLRGLEDDSGNARAGLFAYPAQSNFSGVQHPLEWITIAHRYGFDVLLDAAAYAPTNRIDLADIHPDFMSVSWYKVFGYPTGLGCLIARREALARLQRPWWSGRNIQAVNGHGDGGHPLDGAAAFEDGTVDYLSIPDVAVGLRWLSAIGIDTVHTRVQCLTGWLLDHLVHAHHSTGTPLVRIYGPTTTDARGGTIAFNVLDPAGRVVDERVVARDAARATISLRTGCCYRPGGEEGDCRPYWENLRLPGLQRPATADELLAAMGMPPTGAIRISFGMASTLHDVARFLDFVFSTYLDRFPDTSDLPTRVAW